MTPDNILTRLLYRDALMLVIDKPAGIPVHKGTGGGETLDMHFDALRFGLSCLPALAHRLDRDTSGCLVLGRHRKALEKLGKMFANGKIAKTYWAVVAGAPPESEGLIDLPLAKQSESGKRWWMKIAADSDKDTLPAQTRYKLLGKASGISWLELEPLTGRTHQLRVHCGALGCPIVGDKIYGKDSMLHSSNMQLHARAITIPLYPKKDPVHVTAPVPPHMQELLRQCGWREV